MRGIAEAPAADKTRATVFGILWALTLSHLLNDTLQSLIPAVYPILKSSYALDFSQIGLITLTMQLTASLLQPVTGLYTDHHPKYYALPAGMAVSATGLILLSRAPGFAAILLSVGLVGVGSSIFHPEASRIARMASGGRHGFAQSLFGLGGNAGSALGPLLAAFVVRTRGQGSIAWFALVAVTGMLVLTRVSAWYKARSVARAARGAAARKPASRPDRRIGWAMTILVVLLFSKYFYLSSLVNYYTFFLIGKFRVSVENAQLHLFVFLAANAIGSFVGGPVGDRIGRKYVIWGSILGVLPFTLLLPHANLLWTGVLSVVIGLILSSAFAAILVYAQDLVPGRVGTIAGVFFGLAFGLGGIGAAVLGEVADRTSIDFVYRLCAYLPAIGLLAAFLPKIHPAEARSLE